MESCGKRAKKSIEVFAEAMNFPGRGSIRLSGTTYDMRNGQGGTLFNASPCRQLYWFFRQKYSFITQVYRLFDQDLHITGEAGRRERIVSGNACVFVSSYMIFWDEIVHCEFEYTGCNKFYLLKCTNKTGVKWGDIHSCRWFHGDFTQKKNLFKRNPLKKVTFSIAGKGFEPHDLRVMRFTLV